MLALFFAALLSSNSTAQAKVMAKVNGDPIEDKEVDFHRHAGEDRTSALNRRILFRLAVQEAKRLKVDETPTVREEIDRALYSGFLKTKLAEAGTKLEPTETDMKSEYEKYPLVRLRHLLLRGKSAEKKVSEIQKKLAARVPFTKLVLRYSDDESAKWGGDLDFRGLNALPEAFYRPALGLPVGGHAGPIRADGHVHFLELVAKKNYAEAQAGYVQYLKSRLRGQREEAFLASALSELRSKANIDTTGVSE